MDKTSSGMLHRQASPGHSHTAQHNVLMRPLPARAGSGLLQYNLTNFISGQATHMCRMGVS